MSVLIGIFLVLHGLVHSLYFGQAARFFELRSGMAWPDGSRVFSGLLGIETTRIAASGLCALAAAGFILAGVGLFAAQSWWRPVAVSAAALSAVVFILFWDGQVQWLAEKGLFAILINLAILVALLAFRWPSLKF